MSFNTDYFSCDQIKLLESQYQSCLALQLHLHATCKIIDITQLSTCNYNIVNDNRSNLTCCSLVKHYLLYKSTNIFELHA